MIPVLNFVYFFSRKSIIKKQLPLFLSWFLFFVSFPRFYPWSEKRIKRSLPSIFS